CPSLDRSGEIFLQDHDERYLHYIMQTVNSPEISFAIPIFAN
ncbi:2204_t:CDS:1, partial [Dentiscutata heterogama]